MWNTRPSPTFNGTIVHERAIPQKMKHLIGDIAPVHDERVRRRHDQEVCRPVEARTRDTHLAVIRSRDEPGANRIDAPIL